MGTSRVFHFIDNPPFICIISCLFLASASRELQRKCVNLILPSFLAATAAAVIVLFPSPSSRGGSDLRRPVCLHRERQRDGRAQFPSVSFSLCACLWDLALSPPVRCPSPSLTPSLFLSFTHTKAHRHSSPSPSNCQNEILGETDFLDYY